MHDLLTTFNCGSINIDNEKTTRTKTKEKSKDLFEEDDLGLVKLFDEDRQI